MTPDIVQRTLVSFQKRTAAVTPRVGGWLFRIAANLCNFSKGPVKRHGTQLSSVGTSNRRRSMPFAETHVMEERKRFKEAHSSVRSSSIRD